MENASCSVVCRPGEIVGLVGLNGSGKSTLMRIIFGVEPAESKYISVCGRQIINFNDNKELIKYLPQETFLPKDMKVKKAIQLLCEEPSIMAVHPLIAPHMDRRVGSLSSGERRIVEILSVISSKAKFILLDEPFRALAPLTIVEIQNQIRLEANNKGFIVTDHYSAALNALTTNLNVLKDGRINIF